MIRRCFSSLGLALGWLFMAGCSLLIDVGGDQCSRDSDCDGFGFEGVCEQGICARPTDMSSQTCDGGSCATGDAGPQPGNESPIGGSCLGSLRCEAGGICFKDQCVVEREVSRFICEAAPPPTPAGKVAFRMPVRDFVSEEPPAGLVVRACNEGDPSCANPIAMFDDTMGTGDVELELPYGFNGFLEVESPALLTSLWYFTVPLVEETEAKVLKAVAPATVQLLAAITSLTVDASKGIVILEAFDCIENAVGGIHFEESKQAAIPFFIIDGQPNKEATVSVRNDLENQAAGGFLNATPGFTNFSARIGIDGPVLGTFNANVRPNTVTYLDFHP